ncbi:MAG: hypothetical protein HUU41_06950 [Bryobacteraceae bacterium]|nr:hypothetical protein [Bryobacterales bacterium]MEB2360904.1 hypothetical protein [Bryobacterales bacterium]NUN00833.1 hypothetical protein [Bryobacteraceae bacterium]
MKKLTRRELAAGLAAVSVAQAQRKTNAEPLDDLERALKGVRDTGERLSDFDIPLSTEPAFQFRA